MHCSVYHHIKLPCSRNVVRKVKIGASDKYHKPSLISNNLHVIFQGLWVSLLMILNVITEKKLCNIVQSNFKTIHTMRVPARTGADNARIGCSI